MRTFHKLVKGVAVSSMVGGDMHLHVTYPAGVPGVLSRLEIAAEIERILTKALKPARKRARVPLDRTLREN